MPGYAMTSEGLAGIQDQKNQTGLIMMYGLLAGGPLLLYRPPKRERYRIWQAMALLFFLLLVQPSKTCLSIIVLMPPLVCFFNRLTHSACPVRCGHHFPAGHPDLHRIWLFPVVRGHECRPFRPVQKMTFTSRTDLCLNAGGNPEAAMAWCGFLFILVH
ncbi:hypothetical protein [Komagataeibacter saccharivorans]|uniref:hypothetical protein n=1 Tax=Komagataeibacter saccharivorans TaxID=265959 RepID=UPI000C864D9F|nr:hypothetical protein [Komagataeibacter saccharivorans]